MIGSWAFSEDVVPVPLPEAIDGPALDSLVGLDVETARTDLDAQGWVVAVERQRATGSAAGEVLAQNPIPGNRWARGQVVTLLVSDGPPLVEVPDVVGLHRRDAIDQIRTSRLVLTDVEEVFHEEIDVNLVIATSLASGDQVTTPLPEGSEIAIQVSKGPKRRTMPNLIGATLEDAAAQLLTLDVGLTQIGEDFSLDIPEGAIIASQPLPNALVEKNGVVEVIVSKGKPFVNVPQTRGQTVARATERLEAAGLVVIGVEGAPNRPVLITDPEPGASVRIGTEVLIYTRR
jgi:serine/threonine-protein kinase